MHLAKVRGTRQELITLGESFRLHRRAARKLSDGRLEVPAVLDYSEISFLELKGYEVQVLDDVTELLTRRVKTVPDRAVISPGEDLFKSADLSSAYMDVNYIENWNRNLASVFPALCSYIETPNKTWEGRTTSAVRVSAGETANRVPVLITSGLHAAELGGPDSCVLFLNRLLNAYTTKTAIVLGSKTYSSDQVQAIVETLDLFVFPCVNPDGRFYVMESKDWWRKNRNPNAGMNATGVDINRNFDFLWSSGIGSSFLPGDDTYKGASPFSEPETRNVKWLLDQSGAGFFLDVHGYAGQLDQTWGDAQNQSVDPSMNFQNALWDGRRGVPYREYIGPDDASVIQNLGQRMEDAANSVRKGNYQSSQSFLELYPTTATSDDYAYSRHLLNPAINKTYAYTLEYGGTDYFPVYPKMLQIIQEINAVMLELCDAAVALATTSAVKPPLSGG